MFTGIIEDVGVIDSIERQQGNRILTIRSSLAGELTENQSVAHDGACLSVTSAQERYYTVTAVKETLECTYFRSLKEGDPINLERALPADGRFEGHIVQAHIDEVLPCTQIDKRDGSWQFTFSIESSPNNSFLIPKGSVAINGVSLTIAALNENSFSVAIIPYTYKHTNFQAIREGNPVNVEYDIMGKYAARLIEGNKK